MRGLKIPREFELPGEDATIRKEGDRLIIEPAPPRSVGEAQVCTSIIVAAELRTGATKKGSQRLAAQLEAVLGALDVLPFEPPADAFYGTIRAALEQAGQPIGGNDLLIAAHAAALGHTIATDNRREFARIAGIASENWLRDSAA